MINKPFSLNIITFLKNNYNMFTTQTITTTLDHTNTSITPQNKNYCNNIK